jgi:hypothetical protein
MSLDAEDIRRFTETADRIAVAAERLTRMNQPSMGSNQANFTFSMGSLGVWIASTCCLIMLAVALVGGMSILAFVNTTQADLAEQREKDQQHDDYLAAIYMQAPHLKPKEPE